jgi:hypothetical protein
MVQSLHIGAWVSAFGLVGCQVFDPALLDESRSFGAAIRRDGGPSSPASPDSGTCMGGLERCNDRDDDCDGDVDEDADDGCRLANAIGGCASGGNCVIAECERGYLDCNGRSSDGCEQDSSELQCGLCGTACAEDGGLVLPDAGSTQVGLGDAAVGDDDCDDKVDEAPANCALDACIATAPSYRGAACDRCVCQRCAPLVAQCQNHTDARWAMLCRDVTECYVTESRADRCGADDDCYGSGNGPCADEIRLASGGTSASDGSKVVSGCAVASPPSTACAAVSAYRAQCTRDSCANECAD